MSPSPHNLPLLIACACAGLLLPCFADPCHAEEEGLVVETVAPDSLAAKAGIQAGDRLLVYDGKSLASVAALQALQQNTFGKKEVGLQVRQGVQTRTLAVPLGPLGLLLRPDLPATALRLFQEGRTAQQA